MTQTKQEKLAYQKIWNKANPEKLKGYNRSMAVRYPERRILYPVKSRAKGLCIPFNLTPEDVIIPEFCPVLGIPIFRGTGKLCDNSPSFDRITPELGYVKGNVKIISNRANRIKTDATVEELHLIINYILENKGET